MYKLVSSRIIPRVGSKQMILTPDYRIVKRDGPLKWKPLFRREIFKANRQSIRQNKQAVSKSLKRQLNDVAKAWWQRQLDLFLQLNKQQKKDKFHITITSHDVTLPYFPHNYYAFYIPLTISCKFPDQLTWFFSYFYGLQDQGRTKLKDICYEQISTTFVELENRFTRCSLNERNAQFALMWQSCLKKFTCGLDTLQKLEAYLQLLKYGPKAAREIYKAKKIVCDYDVFFMAILKCEEYFRPKMAILNKNIKSFSMDCSSEINQSALAKTMKMLFCPLCNIYDCGMHEDDSVDYEYGFHYASYDNMLSSEEMTRSALKLMGEQELIFRGEAEATAKPCSKRCYRLIRTKEDYQRIEETKKHFQFSPLIKGIINIGTSCFDFEPCSIWNLVDTEKLSFKVTCDIVFMYLLEDFNLSKKVQLKLKSDESSFLKSQSIAQDIRPAIYKATKAKKAEIVNFNRKKTVCHHHFLNQGSFDLGCTDCECSKRGFCRLQCLCSQSCPLKKGCNCKNSECAANKCGCYLNSRECQPGICKPCFSYNGNPKSNKCKNCVIIEKGQCLVKIGPSKIPGAGLGLFAGQPIKNKQLVITYTGDIIEHDIQAIRESQRQSNDFYNFACNQGSVDSRYLGNQSRFINHGNDGDDNVGPEIKMTQGTDVIVFYAKRDIQQGEELLFNYDVTGQILKYHKKKYPFLLSK